MENKYTQPEYGENKFNCPNCGAFSHQQWSEILHYPFYDGGSIDIKSYLREVPQMYELEEEEAISSSINNFLTNNYVAISVCYQCRNASIWIDGKMVYPLLSSAPLPNQDMPKDVKELYEEARRVSALSPRASTAMLRLALEKLLPQIGAEKGNIDNMIGQLVRKGLPKEVEKALDNLRVIGNEAVHPGTIDIKDNANFASALFRLLNFVVDRMITQLKEIDEIYELLPEGKRKGIEQRNTGFTSKQG
ncbi:DUF4145 domain-containing protein [Priestia megaterium]|uniref:DUF4145 domain-containing protein n=1 Tax=Priestia megaterium TaxID=1404 RepID=UPI002E1BC426|nr:DUF4145 domain-containing protein [Priestia megaterium]